MMLTMPFYMEISTKEVYMTLPLGFKTSNPNNICKLNRSLHGLKYTLLEKIFLTTKKLVIKCIIFYRQKIQ